MAKLRLSSFAQRDLLAIRETSVKEYGSSIAKEFLRGFDRIFTLLREQPYAGQVRDEIGPTDRSFSHKPYRILYRVSGDEVLITRIIHQARDIRAAFLDHQ